MRRMHPALPSRPARLALASLLLLACLAAAADVPPEAAASGAKGMAIDCANALTQAQLNACAHEDFLAAQAALAAQLHRVQQRHDPTQRAALRRVQRAWLAYRTAACDYESLAAAGGSVRPMLQWQCAARLTRERTAALARAQECVEGDLSCTGVPTGSPR